MSTQRYLHTRVATSSALLPIAIVLSLLLWFAQGVSDAMTALGFAATAVCTAFILELNNANVLLRVRSRMVSATFIFIWSACSVLHSLQVAHLATLCLLLAYYSLFRAYQQVHTTGNAFNSFLCIGISVLVVPQMLVFVFPLFLGFCLFQAFNLHAAFAMLLGLLAPVWLCVGYAFYADLLPELWEWWSVEWQVWPVGLTSLDLPQVGLACLLLVLDLISIVHLFQYGYKDKIRTRLLLDFMAWMTVIFVVLLVLFPQQLHVVLALFLANSSPLIGHYFALAEGKVPCIVFVVAFSLLLMIYAANILI